MAHIRISKLCQPPTLSLGGLDCSDLLPASIELRLHSNPAVSSVDWGSLYEVYRGLFVHAWEFQKSGAVT